MALSDIVLKEFKDKGIEVTVYESLAGNGVKCVVDTYNHDKQIRDEVIEEFREKVFGKLCRLTLSMYNFKLYDDALQEAYKEMKGEQNGN